MKKIKQLLLILCFIYFPWFNFSYGTVVPNHLIDSSVSSGLQPGLMVSEFVKISLQELKVITGKKISLPDRVSFKLVQGRMKRYLKHHPDITVTDYLQADESNDRHLTFIWILLGAVILVTIALLISVMHK